MAKNRDCEHCIHKVPVLKDDGTWTAECESWDCEFIHREECLKAFHNQEGTKPEKAVNYIDKSGNYVNIENLTLTEIFNRGRGEGYKAGYVHGCLSRPELDNISPSEKKNVSNLADELFKRLMGGGV